MVKPGAVLPVHGDRRMLAAAAEIAVAEGVPAGRVYLLDDGDRLALTPTGARIEPKAVHCGNVYLDDRPESVGAEVVRERRQLAEEGCVVVLVREGQVDVVSRGVAAKDEQLSGEVSRAALAVLARATPEERGDPEWLRAEIAIAAKRACRRALNLRPLIVPVVV
jgi:ribonuclease J